MTSVDLPAGDGPGAPVPPVQAAQAPEGIAAEAPEPTRTGERRRGSDRRRGSGLSYGNIYTPHAGSMVIQVQREGGLQSRTIVLSQRQVRVLGFLTSRTGKLLIAGSAALIAFLLVEAVRIPSLMGRISRMEHTAVQLDTLEHSLAQLQKRYDQVRTMMGANTGEAEGQTPAGSGPSGLNVPPGVRLARDGGTAAAPSVPQPPPGLSGEDGAMDADGAPADSMSIAASHKRRRHALAPVVSPAAAVAAPADADSGVAPSPQASPQ